MAGASGNPHNARSNLSVSATTNRDKVRLATRPRGRPKGSTVYAERDFRALARYADVLIDAPRRQLAPFLRRSGYANDKDIRRARIRWGNEKERLLCEARNRRDESPADTILQLIAHFIEASTMLMDAASPAFEAIGDSLQRPPSHAYRQ